ncbi:unnamed protein product [Heterobilharzia americana]|nr:unnamed protein product [Heterobilharzia americana]
MSRNQFPGGSQEEVSAKFFKELEAGCHESVLTNARSHLWFEEIITRLSCLIETDRDELVSLMQPPESDSFVPPNPEYNSFLTDMGTAAYKNSLASENWNSCLKNSTGELVDLVAIACLDALSKWPDNIAHQPEVCEKNCLPSSLLSISISYLRNFQSCCIPKATQLLLDFIFRGWPNAGLLATMNDLLTFWMNPTPSSENNLNPFEKTHFQGLLSPNGHKTDCQNPTLPPLAIPLRSRNVPPINARGRSTPFTAFVPSDSNSCKLTDALSRSLMRLKGKTTVFIFACIFISVSSEYQPISPIVHFRRTRTRISDPERKFENVKGDTPIQNGKSPRRHSGSQLLPDESCYLEESIANSYPTVSNKLAVPSRPVYSKCVSYYLSRRSSVEKIIKYRWPIMNSYDLALACQLALLFLPPVIFSRLRMMTDILRRVLSNHEHLAVWFVNSVSPEDFDDNPESVLTSDNSSSLENTMHVIVKMFGSLLLRVSNDSSIEDSLSTASSRIRWRECLLCLLLCDSENFLLTPPASLLSYLRRVTNNMGSNNVEAGEVNLEDLIGLFSSSSCTVSKSLNIHSRLVHRPSEYASLPACVPSIRSASNAAFNFRRLNSLNSGDDSLEFASNPSRSCRNGSLESSPSRMETESCRRNFCHDNCRNSIASSTSSIFFQSDLDPKRLALLGNTAHLIKLLNQIIDDRDMNPRRKMKCLQDFRKSHPDVFWLRFGSEETASKYLSRLQRRIDSQTYPSVFERITNVLRRLRLSPIKQQDSQQNNPGH